MEDEATGAEGTIEDFSGFRDAAEGTGLALLLSRGGSTYCDVELKNRARLGRRNVGGSVAFGTRISSKDFLIVLVNILTLKML